VHHLHRPPVLGSSRPVPIPGLASSGYAAAGFFGFRTPILPYDTLAEWSSGLSARQACQEGAPAGSPGVAAAIAADGARLRVLLTETIRRPEIRAALALASPDLDAALDSWLRGEGPEARRNRVVHSLIRYLARMAGRPTPFGLCAAFSVGGWGSRTRLDVPTARESHRHTRLDMAFLGALGEALARNPAARRSLPFRPNPSLYRIGGRLRYLLAEAPGATTRMVALEPSPPLETILARAWAGARPGCLARALLEAEPGAGLAQAELFVQELIEEQVLVPGLQPAITGAGLLGGLAATLAADPGTAGLAADLRACAAGLGALDAAGWSAGPGQVRELTERFQALGAPPVPGPLLHVDLYKPWPGLELGPEVRRALEEGVELLARLGPPPTDPLKTFREAFRDRYGTRWVPLLEALDGEAGIGFPPAPGEGVPLLAGLAFDPREDPGPALTPREFHLLTRLLDLGGRLEWDLDDRDLEALSARTPILPDACEVLAVLGAGSAAALDAGDFQFLLERFHGPSGARMLGRFCQGDAQLAGLLRDHLAVEAAQRPAAVFAELVHLPRDRAGNIVRRPVLRDWEILCQGRGGAPEARQILLQDLTVGLQGERVVLWSGRLAREVVPRLSSAHDYGRGQGPYRFLAQLQDQDGGGGGWSWGALGRLPFLPRVRRGRHILARARWTFEAEAIRDLGVGEGDIPYRRFQAFRETARLPRHVLLAEGDHLLPVDLDHPLWLEACLPRATGRAPIHFVEFLPGPDMLPARGPEGRFCHEVVLPFRARCPTPRPVVAGPPAEAGPRTFPPGSEWLTVKLYTGASGADRFLVRHLPPLLEATRHLWDRWFFLRYSDPAHHLRLRFHGDPERLSKALLPRLQRTLNPLLDAGEAWKLQTDTYDREIERYGGPEGMAAAEDLFRIDSEAALDLVRACPGDAGPDLRWRMGLKAVDGLLAGMGFDLGTRLGILGPARAGLARELGAGPGVDHKLGERFRGLRAGLEDLVSGAAQTAPPERPGLAILAGRDARLGPVLAGLARAEAGGRLSHSRAELALSFTHLFLNRLLRTAQRSQEFVLYDFLARLYRSRLARETLTAAPAPGCPPPGAG